MQMLRLIGFGALALLFTLYSALQMWGSLDYLSYVLRKRAPIDFWVGLSLGQVAFAVVGAAGMWLCLRRGTYLRGLAFIPLQLVFPITIEALRSDVAWQRSDPSREPAQVIKVLDGDTLIFGSQIVRLRGIDAPELAPNAKCWAEAALAGDARNEVEGLVSSIQQRRWKVADPEGRDEHGHVIAKLVRDDGEDLADLLVVGGYAARSASRKWDWCGPAKDLRDLQGPNLWYPPDEKIDPRTID
jgi:endonuclease YncB( thermonuclease family)